VQCVHPKTPTIDHRYFIFYGKQFTQELKGALKVHTPKQLFFNKSQLNNAQVV